MTTTTTIFRSGSVVIWPDQQDGDGAGMEHALAVQPYDDCIVIEQNGNLLNVPRYALDALIKTLREMKKAMESK